MKPAEERGSLNIAPKVVERVAQLASREITGSVKAKGGLGATFAREYPRVGAEVSRGRANVEMEIAVVWPTPIPELTAEVASHVREQVLRCAGITVDRIDVSVGQISLSTPPNRQVL